MIAPFRALATPLVDTVQPMRYPQLYEMEGRPDSVAQEQGGRFSSTTSTSAGPMAVAQLRVLGGAAMARVPVETTPFAHRSRRIMIAAGAVRGTTMQRFSRN